VNGLAKFNLLDWKLEAESVQAVSFHVNEGNERFLAFLDVLISLYELLFQRKLIFGLQIQEFILDRVAKPAIRFGEQYDPHFSRSLRLDLLNEAAQLLTGEESGPASADRAIRPDKDCRWHVADFVSPADQVLLIQNDGHVHAEFRGERLDCRQLFPYVDFEYDQFRIAFVKRYKIRHLGPARPAPGGPEVKDDRPSPQGRKVRAPAVREEKCEVWRSVTDVRTSFLDQVGYREAAAQFVGELVQGRYGEFIRRVAALRRRGAGRHKNGNYDPQCQK
jgi:hypothetical protein